MQDDKRFTQLVKELIKRSGQTQREIALSMNIDAATLNRWLNRTRTANRFETIMAFTKTVGATDDERLSLCQYAGFAVQELPGVDVRSIRRDVEEAGEFRSLSDIPLSTSRAEIYLADQAEPLHLRLRLLEAYLHEAQCSEQLLTQIASQGEPALRLALTQAVFGPGSDNIPIVLPEKIVTLLIKDSDNDVAAAAIKAARNLVRQGQLPLSYLAVASNHPYWLVRKYAIQTICADGNPENLPLLFEFRNTSYHVSQEALRQFVKDHLEAGALSGEALDMAIALVEALNNARKVSDISHRKNDRLLEQLRSNQSKK